MRSTSGSKSITITKSAIVVALLFVMAPALHAQNEEGGVLYLGNTSKTETVQTDLTDPGPIGAETTTSLYFGQVALGEGWNTIFSIVNTGATTVNGTLTLTGSNGQPINANFEGQVTSALALSVPSGGSRTIPVTTATAGAPLTTGWARYENIGGNASGVATFQLTTGGILSTAAGVLSSNLVTAATIPVYNDLAAGRFVGFAVANPNSSPVTIRLTTVNENGSIATPAATPAQLNPLPPNSHLAIFLHQINTAQTTFRGSMVLNTTGAQGFVVVALVQNGPLITAVPVINEKAPNIP
jgi:hypothetical protein